MLQEEVGTIVSLRKYKYFEMTYQTYFLFRVSEIKCPEIQVQIP